MVKNINPYQVPESSADGAEAATETIAQENENAPIVRKGVVLVFGVLWNLPLLVLTVLMFTGKVAEDQLEFLMVCWGGTLPFVCLATAFVPMVQRLIFVPELDVRRIRPQLFGTAILWTILTAIGLYATW